MVLGRLIGSVRVFVALSLWVAWWAALAGCTTQLFPETADRSPFTRYDALRDQNPPLYVQDVYGRDRPNIRGRLSEAGR